MRRRRAPALAVWKFASCDGCQLSLLDLEDELLDLAGAVHIAHFREATRRESRGPFDLSLVEGSITTPHDVARIQEVRRRSRRLVSIGACATAGGIQALRNFADVREFRALVYASPQYIDTLAQSTAIADHVRVDFELRGCPIDKRQLLEVISAFLHHRRPAIASHSVCVECKLRGNVCVMVTGTPCLGPITHAGCGRDLLGLPARLLRLLRSDGSAQHAGAGAGAFSHRDHPRRHPAGVPQLQRERSGVPRREQPA